MTMVIMVVKINNYDEEVSDDDVPITRAYPMDFTGITLLTNTQPSLLK